ncbi:MAG: hypothetical protein ABI321_09235 [Polyangia bacterium]
MRQERQGMGKKILGDDPFGAAHGKPEKIAAASKVKRAPARKTEAPKSTRAEKPATKAKPKKQPGAKVVGAKVVVAKVVGAPPQTTEALSIAEPVQAAAPGTWRFWRDRQLTLARAEDQTWLMRIDPSADRFGRDPQLAGRAAPLVDFLYRSLRVTVRGLGHVPETGGAILVARRRSPSKGRLRSLAEAGLARLGWSGTIGTALDASLISHAVSVEHVAHRQVRPLVHPARLYTPLVGSLLRKLGGVPSELSDFARLLDDDKVALAFVGGDEGRGSLDLATVVALALVTGAPIVPVSVGESTGFGTGLFRAARAHTLAFGTPLFLGQEFGAEGAEDTALVARLAAQLDSVL